MPVRRAAGSLLGAAALIAGLAACTSSATPTPDSSAPTPSSSRPPSTRPATATPTGAVVAGPTTTATASCPLISVQQAADDVGQRLDHSTVMSSGGKPVGCDFYPSTGYLASQERLPPTTVPVIEIRVMKYRTTTVAHNAMVLLAKGDPDAYTDPVSGTSEAISFATTVYAPDGKTDRATVFRKGTTVVLVRGATDASMSIRNMAGHVAPNV